MEVQLKNNNKNRKNIIYYIIYTSYSTLYIQLYDIFNDEKIYDENVMIINQNAHKV